MHGQCQAQVLRVESIVWKRHRDLVGVTSCQRRGHSCRRQAISFEAGFVYILAGRIEMEAQEDIGMRSGEGRGGEEGRSRWAPDHLKKKKETATDSAASRVQAAGRPHARHADGVH